MKGVLLHGGYGTRLRPLTHTGPKQLIPLAGKPISQYCLEEIRDSGIRDVVIILGSVWPEKVQEYYGDGTRFGMRIHYIYQGEPKGLAHAVGLAKDFVEHDRFVVYLSDNLLKHGIRDHVAAFSAGNSEATLLLSKVVEPQRFGVAKFDPNGRLEALIEKPKNPPSPFALVGVYFFTPTIFGAIDRLKPSWRGELEITEAIQSLLTAGLDVQHRFVEGWWKDTGTVEDILDANRLILDDKLGEFSLEGKVEEGATLQGRIKLEKAALVRKGATVRGPAYIGEESMIEERTYIGPYTSIGKRCKLASCEIENSIIMDGCRINASHRITDSLIGPETEILGSQNSLPGGSHFVLGERSKLVL